MTQRNAASAEELASIMAVFRKSGNGHKKIPYPGSQDRHGKPIQGRVGNKLIPFQSQALRK